jgi:hypothetical protein
VQADTVIQHIPTSERGEHADFDGASTKGTTSSRRWNAPPSSPPR